MRLFMVRQYVNVIYLTTMFNTVSDDAVATVGFTAKGRVRYLSSERGGTRGACVTFRKNSRPCAVANDVLHTHGEPHRAREFDCPVPMYL